MVLAYIMALAHIIVLVVKLAVNLYYDVACVMVSARVIGLSVNPRSQLFYMEQNPRTKSYPKKST